MKPAERIVFNTGVLYMRLLFVMAIGLFTTRIVLDALGETNYGIYTLVAGVVGMLAILQSAMSTTSLRYMSHSLGSGDEEQISRTFNTTLFLHILIGVAIVAFIEIGGYFMFKYFLEIPPEKVFDAKVVFHLMALTTFISIIAVPYDAVINSHENLLALSVVDIFGAVLKLGLAFYLLFSKLNLLILYGAGIFSVQVILRLIKQQYSIRKYKECWLNLKNALDKKLSKEIMAFTGWNLFGSVAAMSVKQVRSVFLNMFFGVYVNASEGVAKRGSSHVNMVSVNLTRAINPLLIKTEGGGDRLKMLKITSISTKFSVFLFALFAIPVIIELPFLYDVWLKKVPEYAVIFTRLTLIGLLINKFTFEITTAIRAVGRIKEFQVTETIIIVMNLPVSYFLFKAGYPPETIYMVSILFSLITSVFRLYYGKKIAGLNIKRFIIETFVPSLLPIIVASTTGFLFIYFMEPGGLRFILSSFFSLTGLIFTIRYFSLTDYELDKIKQIIHSTKNRILLWRKKNNQ